MTTAEALAWGRSRLPTEHGRDADLLLRAATGWDRASVLAHPEAELDAVAEAAYRASIARRAVGEPVQYILGQQEFYGLEFYVTPDVLIPRPETEHLVEAVLSLAPRDRELKIADIGTGSGAISVTLARQLPLAKIIATDISQNSLQIAIQNAERHAVSEQISFRLCDLLDGNASAFDFIVSNPPYIAEGDRDSLAVEVKDHEPAQALFAGADGLDIYRRLVPLAWQALKPAGWLAMEMGAGQHAGLAAMLAAWQQVHCLADLQGIPRVVLARRP